VAWGYRASTYAASTGPFNAGGGTNQRAVTEGAAVSSGDRVYAIVVLYPASGTATPGVPTVADNLNAGNYNLDDSATYVDGSTHVWAGVFSKANSAAGTPVVTATAAETGDQGLVATFAYSGLLTSDPGWDVRVHATGTGGTAASGTTGATSAANELVLGVYLDDGWSSGAVSGAGTGYTQRGVTQSNSVGESQVQDQDSGASGGTFSSSLSSGHPGGGSITWTEFCIVYKLASGGGGTTFPITVSCTQSQVAALAKTVQLTRAITQSQTAALAKTIQLARAIIQSQAVALTKLAQLSRAVTQSQFVSLGKVVSLTRSISQSQSVVLSALRVFLITVSAVQGQAVSVSTVFQPFTGVLNQIRLRIFSSHDSDPGNWIDS
jgi:hypothetical protein